VFYAAVVVPVGSDVLGAFVQGLVTQRVTDYLAVIGLGWHLLYGWELLADPDRERWRRRARAGGWLLSLAILAALALVHLKLDALLDADDRDDVAFYRWHAVYLWGAAVQWFLALGQAWLTLVTWGGRNARSPA
jgi:hypothetical protein